MHAIALLAAAASWSAPQTVSTAHTFAGPLLVSAGQRGGALAAWGWQDGIGQHAPVGASSARTTGAVVSAQEPAPAGLTGAAAYGDGRSVELASRQVDTRGQRFRVSIRDGRTTTLATAFVLFNPQLAVASDGSAIATWVELRGRRQIVRAATRRGTGRFSKPFTLSARGQTTVLAGAAAPKGEFLVAFVRNGRLLARVKHGRWGAAHQLARAQGKTHWQLDASMDGSGNAELVWIRHRFTRPGLPGVRELFAAGFGAQRVRPAWGSVQRVERDNVVGVSLTRAPVLVLAYAFGPNSSAVARVRYGDASGHFGAPMDAGSPQGGLRSVSVAFDPATGLVAGWVIPNPSGDGGGIGYAAATGPAAAATSFGPREQVTPNEAAFDMRLVDTGAGVRAFWTARPEGTGPSVPVGQVHTVVRTSLRSE